LSDAKNSNIHRRGEITLSEILKTVRSNPEFYKAGAVGIFIGVVRGETPQGDPVKKLELEAYDEKADETLKKICEDLQEQDGVIDVQIHHFTGEFEVSEDLVYVAVAGAHRQDVFKPLMKAVERYKKEAPIFKKEHVTGQEGTARSYWVYESKTT
jgi:molybdopterin synthase catalytic subunit